MRVEQRIDAITENIINFGAYYGTADQVRAAICAHILALHAAKHNFSSIENAIKLALRIQATHPDMENGTDSLPAWEAVAVKLVAACKKMIDDLSK